MIIPEAKIHANNRHWISRNTLIELLKELPWDAELAMSINGNLVWWTDKCTGHIDFESQSVESIPDRG